MNYDLWADLWANHENYFSERYQLCRYIGRAWQLAAFLAA